ncbi:hypothetical protein Landi51_12753 [Colletotrichum acutatum]
MGIKTHPFRGKSLPTGVPGYCDQLSIVGASAGFAWRSASTAVLNRMNRPRPQKLNNKSQVLGFHLPHQAGIREEDEHLAVHLVASAVVAIEMKY